MKRFVFLLLLPCMVFAQGYQGDHYLGDTVRCDWNTFDANGASVTRATDGTISVYKDGGTTETTTGVTDTEDFDGLTGTHHIAIATTDSFYVAGSDYSVKVSGASIDGQTVNAALCSFSLENRELKGLVKERGTATTGSTTTLVELGTDEVSDDDEFKYMVFWNVSTGEKSAITGASDDDDTIDVYPPLFTAPLENDVWRILVENPQATFTAPNVAPDGGVELAGTQPNLNPATKADQDRLLDGIIFGAAATGTLSTTQATTDLTGYGDDQLNGAVMIILTGNAAGERTRITDYEETGGLLTFVALTTAMANGDLFKIL